MKYFLSLIALLSFTAFSQPGLKPQKADSCYKRGAQAGKKRFAEWECGKLAGVVDCNEKLELDPQSNTVLVASSHQPFTGRCETCHMNGLLERRVTFVNGKTEGSDTTTFKSGCPMVIRTHVQGVEHGQWTYFYDSLARPAWVQNYSMGLMHGEQVYFNRRGDTTKYEYYIDGVLNGKKLSFDSKGRRMKEVTYRKGIMDGPFLVYNGEGKIIEELTYKDGKKNGVFKYYYDDGTLLKTENWNMDVRNGEFKTLYYEGTLQTLEVYRKGQKEGWFEERYPDQKVKRKALYKKDILVEEHVFDEYGKETYTFGGQAKGGAEDDAMPVSGKKKKEKEKKPAAEGK
jgi:antitoxin component YwqK of YwqJK toxin-antitoxin module